MTTEQKHLQNEDEIDLIGLIEKLWKRKTTIIKSIIICFSIGLIIAILSPTEFTAKTVVVPQTLEGKVGGSIGGLAAMAGINLNETNSDGIPPSLYPKIVQSIPFQKELIKTHLNFEEIDHPVTYAEYYDKYTKTNILGLLKKYTIGLPSLIFSSLFSSSNDSGTDSTPIRINDSTGIYSISKKEKMLFNQLASQLSLNVNDKEGFVELSFSMPEALPSAEMTKRAQSILQNAVTTFKVKKAKQQLTFIEERYEEAQKDFKEKQFALAKFQDQNRGLNSSLSQTQLERLRSEYNLSYGIFSELAKQLEAQKIQIKKDTPAFTIIEPVGIPLDKSKPKRGMIIAIWTFLGFVIGVGIVFIRNYIEDYRKNKTTTTIS